MDAAFSVNVSFNVFVGRGACAGAAVVEVSGQDDRAFIDAQVVTWADLDAIPVHPRQLTTAIKVTDSVKLSRRARLHPHLAASGDAASTTRSTAAQCPAFRCS